MTYDIFRYSLSPSLPGDNCHLGERLYRNLDPYIDFIPDREYDIYARNEFGRPDCIPKRFYESGKYTHNIFLTILVRVSALIALALLRLLLVTVCQINLKITKVLNL